jgi:hypothetical protein
MRTDNPKPLAPWVPRRWVEAVLWARDTTLTFLELEPLSTRLRHLARLPRADSLIPYPDDFTTRSW